MPDWKAEVRNRLGNLEMTADRAEEIVEEMGGHLEERYREQRGAGASEEEARRSVLAELAGPRLQEDLGRAVHAAPKEPPTLGTPPSGRWGRGVLGDVRHAVRSLRKTPTLTAIALLTLSLGIGANAAIFSVVNTVLLRPLAFAEPDRLVTFQGSAPEAGLATYAYPDALYVYFRTRSRVLEDVSAYTTFTRTLTGAGEPERLSGAGVTADFFRLLGRTPREGRAFLPEEEAKGRNQVTVLSHGLWQRRFGGDPAVVGKSITLDGAPFAVVGVMPPGFEFPNRSDLWFPLATDPSSLDCWCHQTLGRLRPGRSPEDAAREIARLHDDFYREREGKPVDSDSTEVSKTVVITQPLARSLVGEVETPLLVLLGAVGTVLLIACANIANLLLARASAREREIAVRCCLGASPWRIVRQLLVESLVLGFLGAAVGLGLAFWAVRALGHLAVERFGHLDEVTLDGTVLMFTVVLTLATVVLFGLAPALRGARIDLLEAVKDGARGARGGRSRRLSDAFAVAQIASSLVLLVGAGLLLRSFQNLLDVDLGFRPDNVLVGRVSLPIDSFEREPVRAQVFFRQLEEGVSRLPGVQDVGLSSAAPFSDGGYGQVFDVRGHARGPGEPKLVAQIRIVTPGYFSAVGTAPVRGRLLEETDTAATTQVVVVDETLARRFWPDGNAMGHEIRLGNPALDNPWLTIVGVVRSVKHKSVIEDPERYVYRPLAQRPFPTMDVVVKTSRDPAASTAALREELRRLDPTLPLYGVQTLQSALARALGTQRLTNSLLTAFAVIALLLAAVGIYGVMAVGVAQRVNEFGIRLALGAAPENLLGLVLRQGMRLVVVGLTLGLLGAAALTRFLGSLLFEVPPLDPLTFVAVSLLLTAVTAAACALPARRAATTDPLVALRHE